MSLSSSTATVCRVAVLTVSDTASKDATADRSGPVIVNLLQDGGMNVVEQKIVPDDEDSIRETIRAWIQQESVDWIITSGGTGFGIRDRTPEAIAPLIEREAPGIIHLLLSSSIQKTHFAALSRPVAGTIGRTLVVTLPGSVRAVQENTQELLKDGFVQHAIELLKGDSGERVHTKLAQDAGTPGPHKSSPDNSHNHHHHHHHHHTDHVIPRPRTILSHDPSLPASARHRVSPYPIITFVEAISLILKEVQTLSSMDRDVGPWLRGHVLAEDVYAPANVPASYTTNVDGYALRSTNKPGTYKVVTARTYDINSALPPDSVYRINTGAPLPVGADSVIMVEDTELVSTLGEESQDLSAEEKEIKTLAEVPKYENVRAPGSDVKKGDLVLSKSDIIRGGGGEIGTLAFVGRQTVSVIRKPMVALISTGNELMDLQATADIAHQQDGFKGIYDTNRPSLQATLESMGYQVVDLGIVKDNLDAHVNILKSGLQCADIVITTGGTSMGASDLLKPVIERHLEGTIHFGRVAVKPGKPTTFATVPASTFGFKSGSNSIRKPVFALPGNPASALVTFYLFVIPALRKMGGWPLDQCQLPRVPVKLTSNMKLDPRAEFHRVVIRAEKDGLVAHSTGGQRSSRVASLSEANGLVALPLLQKGGPSELLKGEITEAIVIGEIRG